MPRESSFRQSTVASSARRRLFSDSINHEELNQRLQNQLDEEMKKQSERWNFDFQTDTPLLHNSASSSSTTIVYESLDPDTVPLVYRSETIIRREIPNVGVIEIKHYPHGQAPIQQSSTKPESIKVEGSRKRHLPSPLTSPMKLRKRNSPFKTPINTGPKPGEHLSRGTHQQRPRRNLVGKFEICEKTSAVHLLPSTSSSSSSSQTKSTCK